MMEKLIDILWKVKEGTKHPNKAYKEISILCDVGESRLTIPDIRNKLSPITHLISMVERQRMELAKKAIPTAKDSINYLAKREVYSK